MTTPTRAQAEAHYARQVSLAAACVAAIRELFRRSPAAVPTRVASFQYAAAASASRWVATLVDEAPLVRPEAFAGWTSEGLPVSDALAPILADLAKAKESVAAEFYRLERAVASQVADAGRSASQVEFSSRPNWTNYVRMLSAPSCSRCAILAGRIYRDIEAFQRHPNCDCVMVPVTSWQEAHDAGLVSSFRAAFGRGEVTGLSKADQRAIRDGANVNRVVNASRGTTRVGGLAVTSSLTGNTGKYRMRPEAIYRIAGDDFVTRLRLLKQHGYIGNQVDQGSFIDGPAREAPVPNFRPGQDAALRRLDEQMRAAGSSGGGANVPPMGNTGASSDDEFDASTYIDSLEVHLDERQAHHITQGDAGGGGHLFGTKPNEPGRKVTWFPANWDAEKALGAVLQAATTDRRIARWNRGRVFINAYGEVDGIRIKVRISPTGAILTGHALDGPGVVRAVLSRDGAVTTKTLEYGANREVQW